MRRPVHRSAPVVICLVGCTVASLALAACGSRLDAQTVLAANGSAGGEAGAGTAAGALGADDPLAGQGAAPSGEGGGTTGSGGGRAPSETGGEPAGGAATGTGENAATGEAPAGPCRGFRNQTGITDDTIVIANASDISGPVPGLFESARDGTRAFAAYFNATSDLCGRKLEVMALDSRTDAGADQQAYAEACEAAFAAVGSMSAFDSGGAATADRCGIPDIRSTSVTPERNHCSTCFSAQSVSPNLVPNSVPDYFVERFRPATQKAAMLALNVGATRVNADSAVAAYERRGFRFVYQDTIDVSEFNYAPYVQEMEARGVRWVRFLGAYPQAVRLAQAMQQQGFEPDVFLQDSTVYTPRYAESGGDAVDGTRAFMNIVPFEEASSSKEMQLYNAWLQQVHPGATPDFFGVYAWSAARLFVEQAAALGGRLDRDALVRRVEGVGAWTGNGIHSPQPVGPKRTSECFAIIRLEGDRWVRESPGRYMCHGLTDSGIGG